MQTSIDCLPCFVRQALEAAKYVTDDPAIRERVIREVLRLIADTDLSIQPPAVGQVIHRKLRELVGSEDPYRAAKQRANELAIRMLPALRTKVEEASDPLDIAARIAVAGNVIDLGVGRELSSEETRTELETAIAKPLVGDFEQFRQAVNKAERILYLAANAGEIVFDSLLLERLPGERVTVAVRGGPIINDATLADAAVAGLSKIVGDVIDNGSDAPGTLLSDTSTTFQYRFEEADLIISKGQGNFECLSNEPWEDQNKQIFYLFKVKCSVAAALVERPLGTHVVMTAR